MSTGKAILEWARENPLLTFLIIGGIVTAAGKGASEYYQAKYNAKPQIHHEQAVCGPVEDTYVIVDGVKFYSKVDGLPIEDRCPERVRGLSPKDAYKEPGHDSTIDIEMDP